MATTRASAWLLLALLAGASLASVPLASASQPASASVTSIRLLVDGIESSDTASPAVARIGSALSLVVAGTLSVGPNDCGNTPAHGPTGWWPHVEVRAGLGDFAPWLPALANMTVRADRPLDPSPPGSTPAVPGSPTGLARNDTSGSYNVTAFYNLTVGSGGVDGVVEPVRVSFLAECQDVSASAPTYANRTSSETVLLDNVAPQGRLEITPTAGELGVGASYSARVVVDGGTQDLDHVDLDLGAITPGAVWRGVTDISTLDATLANLTVGATGDPGPAPRLLLTDLHGNVAMGEVDGPSFDTLPPGAPSDLVASPQSDGAVLVRFAPPPDEDVAGHEVRLTNLGNGTTISAMLPAGDFPNITLSPDALSQGATYGVQVRSFDGAGNRGAWFPTRASDYTFVSEAPPLHVTIAALPSASAAAPSAQGTWSGRAIQPGSPNVTLQLRSLDANLTWNGSAVARPDGTWSGAAFAASLAAANLSAGRYVLAANLTDARHAIWNETTSDPFLLDPTPPLLLGDTLLSAPVLAPGDLVRVSLNASALSGLSEARLRLVDAEGVPLSGADGAIALVNCGRAAPSCVATPPLGDGAPFYNGTLAFALPDAALASPVRLELTLVGGTGVASSPTIVANLALLPRVAVDRVRAPPQLDANGELHVDALAAFVAPLDSMPDRAVCAANRLCDVDLVEIDARVAGSTGEGTKIANLTVFTEGPLLASAGPGAPMLGWYGHEVGPLTLPASMAAGAEVRAVGVVSLAGAKLRAASPWTRVLRPNESAGLGFVTPSADEGVMLDGSPGSLRFEARYDDASLALAPHLLVRLRDETTWQEVEAQPGRGGNVGPTFAFRWTNFDPVAPGRHVLEAQLWADNATAPTANASRAFVVQAVPNVTLSLPDIPDAPSPRPVPAELNLSVAIDHGAAALDPRGIILSLRMPDGLRATPARGNLTATLLSWQDANGHASATFHVRLPHDPDGTRYVLRANITERADAPPALAISSGLLPVVLDRAPPTLGVDADATANLTGTYEAAIVGWARAAHGIADVQVALVDLATGNGYVPSANRFLPGPPEWMTSAPRLAWPWYAKDVATFAHEVDAGGNATLRWSLNLTDRPLFTQMAAPVGASLPPLPLNRSSSTRVLVRAIDTAGLDTDASFVLSLDRSPPNVTSIDLPAVFDADSNATLVVHASDDTCVARVELLATPDGGEPVGPLALAAAPGGACGGPEDALPSAWRLDVPSTLRAPGAWTYAIRAFDGAGHKTDASARTYVRDDVPARVARVDATPRALAPGGEATLFADVLENGGISRVEMRLLDAQGTTIGRANATPRSAAPNGTGAYALSLSSLAPSLPLGRYLVVSRAFDLNATDACDGCVEANASLVVTDEPPPTIAWPAQPVALNATPVVELAINGGDVDAASLRMEATLNGTPLAAQVTRDATPGGWLLRSRFADPLPDGSTLRLVAYANATSGLATNASWTLPVDAAPPVLSLDASGAIPLAARLWASSSTSVMVRAADEGSGLATLTPNPGLPLAPDGPDGPWTIEARATDRAGNLARRSLTLWLDRTPPSIDLVGLGDHVVVRLDDGAGSGLDEGNLTVHWSSAGGPYAAARLAREPDGTFAVDLPAGSAGAGLRAWIEARDLVGNLGRLGAPDAPLILAAPPETPRARFDAPLEGANVTNELDARWALLAGSADRAELLVSRSDGSLETIFAGGDDGHATINASNLEPGLHVLVLRLTAGNLSSETRLGFRVPPPTAPVSLVGDAPNASAAGEPIPVTLELASVPPATESSLVLARNGQPVSRAVLPSTPGRVEASVTTTQPGTYALVVETSYPDGTRALQELGRIDVAAPRSSAPPLPMLLVVALSSVTIGLASYGVWRHRTPKPPEAGGVSGDDAHEIPIR